MWNSLNLICPADDICEYPPHERHRADSLQDFVTVLTNAGNVLASENPLWNEMKVLHNIQVKYKRILRCDRCLLHLQRVGHCLKKMVLLNLSKSYADLAERFLVKFQDLSVSLYLPSRQQVEYLLLRTLTASKLVCEAIRFSRETFCFLIKKLKVGHLILDLVMAASVTARINILLRVILEQLCSLYKEVFFWRYKIKKGTHEWDSKLVLPQDVTDWLKSIDPTYLKPCPMSNEDVKTVSSVLNQKEQLVESDSESVVVINETPRSNGVTSLSNNHTDYGEIIERADDDVIPLPMPKAKKRRCLTDLQISLLLKLLKIQSLKELGEMWLEIKNLPADYFPRKLLQKKTESINRLLEEIKNAASVKKYNKKFENQEQSPYLKTVVSMFCKRLGFIESDLETYRNCSIENEVPRKLVPVRSVKKLRKLYEEIYQVLQTSGETKKLHKLKKIFKRRVTDIKLFKQNGEKAIAKKLILCTSKEFLAMCQ